MVNGPKKPDTSFKGNYTNIVTDYTEFSTKDSCISYWRYLDDDRTETLDIYLSSL